MSVTPTTMKCPVCPESTLETFSASIGSFERCPSCGGLFIHQDLVSAASQDKAKCQEALQEIKTLLLPTEKSCPKCLQPLFDGRVRSRGVILTVCTTCQNLWTDLAILGQFEETIERTLRVQMDLARDGQSAEGSSGDRGKSFSSSAFRLDDRQDSGLGHFFRAFARFFDRWADRFAGREARPASPKPAKPKSKPEKPEKKPLIREVEPAAPAPLPPKIRPALAAPVKPPIEAKRKEPPATQQGGRAPEVWRSETISGPPSIDVPDFVFPEEPEEPTQTVESVGSVEPVTPVEEPKCIEPPPLTQPAQLPEPEPEPVENRAEETKELLRLMGEDSSYYSKPAPKPREEAKKAPAPKPVPKPPAVRPPAAKPPVLKPPEKKPASQPSAGKAGLFAKFKAAWSPAPKKPVKPVVQAKPVEPVTPVPAAAPVPKPVKPQKPKGPGFFAALFPPRKPVVKNTAPIVIKPVPAAKPKRERSPRAPVDHVALWPPWGLALAGIISSSFRDFGFEGLPAVLWGLAGWAIGFMIRLGRRYPFKPFEEYTLDELVALNGPEGQRVLPVILQGQFVPSDELNPKSALIFKQGENTLVLNRLGRWDILPRLFGLSNPRQLPKGEVLIKGWYRPGPAPSLELHDIRAGKVYRKSTVRSLRWAFAISLLVLSLGIYLALD